MAKPKRIVCYAINGAGMGHVTRLLGVARWIRRIVSFLDEQPPEILFLTSSDASDMLADSRFAAFKIPSKIVARSSGLDKLEYRRLAKQFVWHTLGVFAPDLLVVDTFPSGSFDELFQVLDGPFKKGFIYRNVKPEYATRPTFRAAMGLFDSIVIPHREGTRSVPLTQVSDKNLAIISVGEVIQFDREQLPSRTEVRNELGLAVETRLVYVSAGGGGDPNAEATLLHLIETLREIPSIHLLVGAGPLYRGRRHVDSRITWSESPSVWRYFSGCDAAVSAGGYNTCHELLYVGVPTLFYAQEKIADDQWQRVQGAERKGACVVISDVMDSSALHACVEHLLNPDVAAKLSESARIFVPDNGAIRCARELIRTLYPADRLDAAIKVLTPRLVHSLERFSEGSPQVLIDWLVPALPQERVKAVAGHPGLESIIHQLSPSAADEVRKLLQVTGHRNARNLLEDRWIELLEEIQRGRSMADAKSLGDEVFRSIHGMIKKYSYFANAFGEDWSDWVIQVIDGIVNLMQQQNRLSITEMLRLFRAFPRIQDATSVDEVYMLFESYLNERMARMEPSHEILQQIQVLKMAYPNIFRSTLRLSTEAPI